MFSKKIDIPPKSLNREVKLNISDPTIFEIKNGLKVIIVENHKLPIVIAGIDLDIDPFLEGDKAGIQKIFGQMLRSGTENYNKEELDNIIDYMGVNFNTSFYGISISTMKKYLKKSISIMADVAMNCKFDNKKELEKIVKQRITDIDIYEKDPNSIFKKVRNILFFGRNHPYGEYENYETIKNIKLSDLRELYKKYFNPNKFYLYFVGDVNKKEVEYLCNTYFVKWKNKSVNEKKFDEKLDKNFSLSNEIYKSKSEKIEIDFVDIPTLTQSTICFGGAVSLKKDDPMYIPSVLANGILGGGAQSRLFLNLRENKAYTYGAYSVLKSDKYVGYFSIYTQVRNNVTGDAIKTIIKELDKITSEKVSLDELNIKKKEITGQFILDLEDPERISDLFISELRNNLPYGFYKKYLEKIKNVTVDDVYKTCKKFFNLKKGRIIIIGKSSEVLPSIKKLGYPINFFDKNGYLLKNKNV
ncbi:M16 family metallopeptidase [Blattabacterium cuenoti]|uniref:M16 family metallopeptidase n=1 Tax=Blattabacterium cuenoti TaxID=1653831 RepID=UPI00163B9F07|nr:pitrilysin family protein [Blattabacterium cuenoti]